jgi:hypothetical protein
MLTPTRDPTCWAMVTMALPVAVCFGRRSMVAEETGVEGEAHVGAADQPARQEPAGVVGALVQACGVQHDDDAEQHNAGRGDEAGLDACLDLEGLGMAAKTGTTAGPGAEAMPTLMAE